MTTDADRRQDNAKQQQQTNPDKFSNNPPRDGPDSGDKSSNRSPDLISKTELVDANSKKSGQPRLHFGFSIENKLKKQRPTYVLGIGSYFSFCHPRV